MGEKPTTPRTRLRRKNVDGGYAWVVVMASFLGHTLQYGVVWCVGVFYVLFLDNIDGDEGAVALISSLNTAVFYVTGPLAAILTNHYGCRAVSMAGGLIGSLGLILSIFANNIYYLYGTFGVLAGFGLGLSFIPTLSIVSFYFERKRAFALGLAASGVGMGTFIFPPIIRLLVTYFDYRGAILIMGGICLNLLVCSALFRPVDKVTMEHKAIKGTDSKMDTGVDEVPKRRRPKLEIFHLNIFRNFTYMILSINNVFFMFGISVIYVHLSAYAASVGHSENASAMLMSGVGISNFIGRVLIGLLAVRVKSLPLYSVSLIIAGAVTMLLPLLANYITLMVFAVVFGLTTASIGPLLPMILVNCLSVELLPSGYGYLLVFEAIGTLVGGPVAGAIYHWSEYYPYSLYLGGASILLSGIMMIYPCVRPLCKRKKIDEPNDVKEPLSKDCSVW